MASFSAAEDESFSFRFDPSEPLKGTVVCCTSIPPDQRKGLAQKVTELGGVHKYDLTPDVTHLIVGDYNTPKYRHVARERPDIKAMDAAWVDELNDLWIKDDEIDFLALESKHQLKPLEKCGVDVTAPPGPDGQPAPRASLLICLTGFGDQRDEIAEKIASNGGQYTGDLTRRCTHLIVNKPEGKKYAAAKAWGVYAVTLAWLDQTIARGLILEEAKFDPLLPEEEQGVGAWTKTDPRRAGSKRSRSAAGNGPDEGARKLRKTASMKLNSQRNNLWGDILGRATSREYSFANENPQQQADGDSMRESNNQAGSFATAQPLPEEQGIFGGCCFYIHGFSKQRTAVLDQTISTLGGSTLSNLSEATNSASPFHHAFVVVPQTSQPESHPLIHSDATHIITEYYIEKCLHNKQFFEPKDHVLGRPFPRFPIPAFDELTVCSAAFTGIELNQVARSISQLGARFEEEFRVTTGVLVCKELSSIRKEKLRMAIKWGVPVVSADWLWECISTAYKVPFDDFIYPELKSRYDLTKDDLPPTAKPHGSFKVLQRTRSEPALNPSKSDNAGPKPPGAAGVDVTAFDDDSAVVDKSQRRVIENPLVSLSADFATARTHPVSESHPGEGDFDTPLGEVSAARLNKSPPLTKSTLAARTHSEPTKKATTAPEPMTREATPAADARQRLQQAEETKSQARAAERQALSSKLTSLIESTTPSNLGNPNPANHPASAAAVGPNQPDGQSVPRPRRRQILGRAISNVSNASSAASGDVNATKSVGSGSLGNEGGLLDDQGDVEEEGREQDEPPTTQLEYGDPRAQEVKAALLNRMMGGAGEVKKPSTATMAGAAGIAAGGRSMRKR